MDATWDCIVVGAGAAGLSAALVLGRARQDTLVVDAGEQSNLAAHGIAGLLGHDGRPPAELYAQGRTELGSYPTVQLRTGTITGGRRDGTGFVVNLADGGQERTRRLLLATGMEYRYPDIPGIAPRWGRSVFHCPFCHGWEARDQILGVLDAGPMGAQRALLLGVWSDDVTLFTNGPVQLAVDELERLAGAGVTVEERPVAGMDGDGDALHAIVFSDGTQRPCEGLLIAVTLHQRSSLAALLGADIADPGPVAIDPVAVDQMFATSVPGLFAAGDLSAAMPSVATAIAAGSGAAAMVVHSLVAEDHHLTMHGASSAAHSAPRQ